MELSKTKKISSFDIINNTVLVILALSCLIPFINILALSFSSSNAANRNAVSLWPVEFTTNSYTYVLSTKDFWMSYLVTFKRIIIGAPLNVFLLIITAYPLSKTSQSFKFRTHYSWFFFLTMLFNGGLIPTYMVVKTTGLIDKIWALIIPGAVPVFNIVILLNFFRQHPKELEEAALIDGASQWKIMWRIWVPISLPALATVTLFCFVGHWNSWFDGLIYMNRPANYPLQSYLRTIITMPDFRKMTIQNYKLLATISDKTFKSAQIIIAAIPILMIYPLLQKYFVKGLILGSIKG